MSHIIATIEVNPAKGQSQITRWLVEMLTPYPDLSGPEWRNAGTLLPRAGHPATAPYPTYMAFLLAEGVEPPEQYDRTHFAGYAPKPGGPANPGTIVYRGKDLGECSVELDRGITLRSRTGARSHPTPSEAAFLTDQVATPLRAFITTHRAALAHQAASKFAQRCNANLAEYRRRLLLAEAEVTGMAARRFRDHSEPQDSSSRRSGISQGAHSPFSPMKARTCKCGCGASCCRRRRTRTPARTAHSLNPRTSSTA